MLAKAIELEPRYATALAYAAWCRAFAVLFGWSSDPAIDTEEGLRLAAAAVAADPEDPAALRVAGWCRVILAREHDAALALIDKSLALDPNSAMAWGFRGWANAWAEHVEEAKADFERAIRLSPFDSWSPLYAIGMAFVLTDADRAEEALPWAQKAVQEAPEWAPTHRNLAAALAHLGRTGEARAAMRRSLELDPDWTVSRLAAVAPHKGGPKFDRFLDDLRKAGLPE